MGVRGTFFFTLRWKRELDRTDGAKPPWRARRRRCEAATSVYGPRPLIRAHQTHASTAWRVDTCASSRGPADAHPTRYFHATAAERRPAVTCRPRSPAPDAQEKPGIRRAIHPGKNKPEASSARRRFRFGKKARAWAAGTRPPAATRRRHEAGLRDSARHVCAGTCPPSDGRYGSIGKGWPGLSNPPDGDPAHKQVRAETARDVDEIWTV